MSSPEPSAVTIDVISAAKGESIVIRTPSGKWGVVDCYTEVPDDERANPTIEFLNRMQVQRLEFLCLTHPDEDHYNGMSALIRQFNPRRFWQFAGITEGQLVDLVMYRHYEMIRESGSSVLLEHNELRRIFDEINTRRRRHDIDITLVSDLKPLYREAQSGEGGAAFRILSIAPSSNNVHAYQQNLRRCFDGTGQPLKPVPRLRHNSISVGLLLEYGETRAVLGGDVESSNWTEILERASSEWGIQLSSGLVKVSHHGSLTGTAPGLWEAFTKDGGSLAIVTPFRARGLPKQEVVEAVQRQADAVYTPCLPGVPYLQSSLHEITPDYSNELQEGIRMSSQAFYSRRSTLCGRCHAELSENGACLLTELEEPAAVLPPANQTNAQ